MTTTATPTQEQQTIIDGVCDWVRKDRACCIQAINRIGFQPTEMNGEHLHNCPECKRLITRESWEPDNGSKGWASLAGYAGCGKSFTVAQIAKRLEDLRVLFLAPTGKAATVLRKFIRSHGLPHEVNTIHSAIYDPPIERENDLEWKRLGHSRNTGYDLVVVDEASMVTRQVWEDMTTELTGCAFLAVGDHGQLPAIGESAGLMDAPTWRLETIMRQAADNPIVEFARRVRETSIADAMAFAASSTDPRLQMRKIKSAEESREICAWAYAGDDRTDGMVVVATNAARVKVNKIARKALGFTSADPQPGDLVMCLRNNRMIGPSNGERWAAREVRPEYSQAGMVRIDRVVAPLAQFGQERTQTTWARQLTPCDYGYALTCHKAQGSQAARVVVSLEGTGYLAANGEYRRWLYTAATRAAESLLLVS